MPQIILVGVDGSDTSRKAAHVAAELAAASGARLHIMTAIEAKPSQVNSGGQDEEYLGDVRLATTPGDQAEAIARDVAQSLRGIVPSIETSPARGKPGEALVTVAKDIGADLIVVGNRRVQGIGRILGSVATDVAHHAPCDVYIVKTV